ncbi:MAG: hypothetical protein K2R98_19370 [Gemmataceae bacterium]|nr:hypothetical protein [Gemmataceae bacterium]
MFNIGETVAIAAYRGDKAEAMLGRVEAVRNILEKPLSADTIRRNPEVLRSQYLITFVDLDSPADGPRFKSMYDAFIALAGVGAS